MRIGPKDGERTWPGEPVLPGSHGIAVHVNCPFVQACPAPLTSVSSIIKLSVQCGCVSALDAAYPSLQVSVHDPPAVIACRQLPNPPCAGAFITATTFASHWARASGSRRPPARTSAARQPRMGSQTRQLNSQLSIRLRGA